MKKRVVTRQSGSAGKSKNQKQTGKQSKNSDPRRGTGAGRRSETARPEPKPDKHGGTGAGRQQGGSGPTREHD